MNKPPQWQSFGAGVQKVHPWIFWLIFLNGKLKAAANLISLGKGVEMLFGDLHPPVFNRA